MEVVLLRRSERLLPVQEVGQLNVLLHLLVQSLGELVPCHSRLSMTVGQLHDQLAFIVALSNMGIVVSFADERLLHGEVDWHLAEVDGSLVNRFDLGILLLAEGLGDLSCPHATRATAALQAPQVLLLHITDPLTLGLHNSCYLLRSVWHDSRGIRGIDLIQSPLELLKAILNTQIRPMILLRLRRGAADTMLREGGAQSIVRRIDQIVHVFVPTIVLNRLHLALIGHIVGHGALGVNLAASWPLVHRLVHRQVLVQLLLFALIEQPAHQVGAESCALRLLRWLVGLSIQSWSIGLRLVAPSTQHRPRVMSILFRVRNRMSRPRPSHLHDCTRFC